MAVSDGKPGSQLEMTGPADTSPCVWAAPQRAGGNKQHWKVLFSCPAVVVSSVLLHLRLQMP